MESTLKISRKHHERRGMPAQKDYIKMMFLTDIINKNRTVSIKQPAIGAKKTSPKAPGCRKRYTKAFQGSEKNCLRYKILPTFLRCFRSENLANTTSRTVGCLFESIRTASSTCITSCGDDWEVGSCRCYRPGLRSAAR